MNFRILRYGQITDAGIIVLRLWLGIAMVKYSFPVVFNNGFAEFGDWLGSMNFPLPYLLASRQRGRVYWRDTTRPWPVHAGILDVHHGEYGSSCFDSR